MAGNPNAKDAFRSANGLVQYENPGKVVDYYDPNVGLTLNPYKINEIPEANPNQSLETMAQSLLKGWAPSGSGAPAASPFSFDLKSMLPTFANSYKPPTGVSTPTGVADNYFNDYISRIMAPSSVDEVQKGLDTQGVNQLLDEIDQGTNQNIGNIKMDLQDRGLGGPGQVSDIEANAIAQARTGGQKTKAAARLSAYQAELARQKAREEAANAGYLKRYDVGAAADTQARDIAAALERSNNQIAASGAMSDNQILADILGKEYTGSITQREGMLDRSSKESMNYMNQLLDYAMKSGTLSQQDVQFYNKLLSDEKISAANNQAAYDRAILQTRKPDKDWMDYANFGLKVVDTVTGGAKNLGIAAGGKK